MPDLDLEQNQVFQGLRARMRSLEDVEAIRTLKALYARRADTVFRSPGQSSAVALADLFTEDGVLDLGPFGRYEGRAAMLDAFENILPAGTAWSSHYIVNPTIDTTTHTDATGSWYFLIYAQPKTPAHSPAATIWGGYEDKYKKIAGVWRIFESIASYTQPVP